MRAATGITIAISIAIGFGLGHYLTGAGRSDNRFFTATPGQPDGQPLLSVDSQATLSAEQAEASRQQHFADISSIREILSMPTDFGRTEALYALAGRADIGQLQSLIAEANRIDIPGERKSALQILFLRYADIDTRAALLYLDGLNLDIATSIIHGIFRSWAKTDADTAIATANQIDNPQHRRTAAEAIVRTFSDHWPELLDQVSGRLLGPIDMDGLEVERMVSLAATDPRTALAEALTLRDDHARQQAIYGIALSLARQDPQQALATLEQIEDPNLRQQLTQTIVGEWAKNDPEAAIAFARDQGLDQTTNLVTMALQHIAQKDPLTALDRASQLDPRTKRAAHAAIYAVWGTQDIQAAISHAESLNDPILSQQVYAVLGGQYARQFPDEALLWAEQLDGPAKASVMSTVLHEMAASDPLLALDTAFATAATPARDSTISQILHSMAAEDPQTAVAYLDRLPAGALRERSTQNIIRTWANSDLEAAYAWVEQQEGQSYTKTLKNLASHLAITAPEQAAQLTDRIREDARPQWLQALAHGYARRDHQGAVDWLQQYEQQPGYDQALASITRVTAQTDPAAALILAEKITSPLDQRSAIDNITHNWSSRDPDGAARWATTLKDTAQRNSAIQITASQWARHDPDAAGRWVMGLDDTEARDTALTNLVHRNGSSPELALPLANAIESDQQRVQAITSLAINLARYDTSRAERMLEQANIDAQTRAQIKQQLQQHVSQR